ncbi:MAG: restriction endonuclease [Myxococcales bacterium]|nr:restriction endonuclease [Myxococcales bacterium]
MDFIERLRSIGTRIEQIKDRVETEEATKNAFIMPFIQALGYDVFNPMEVVPEFTADVGIKKGEKVDYAILKDDQPIIIIECKSCATNLADAHASQLYRYFGVVEARISILTNGIDYWFYSDTKEPNKMDAEPFLRLDMTDLHESQVDDLKKMRKGTFDVDEMLSAASDLKYRNAIKAILAQQLQEPDEDFVRFFASQLYEGRFVQSVKDQFTDLVQRAFREFINERLAGRLQAALDQEDMRATVVAVPEAAEAEEEEEELSPEELEKRKKGIVTTDEEQQGFLIVKAILAATVELDRVHARDTKSYFGVLLDDNNRKPLCRLHFNTSQNYIGLFDAEKNETREPLDTLGDIYKHADAIRAMVAVYDGEE